VSGDPAVSVVVATRNRAGRLRRLLDGLAAQDLGEPFEVVVVDDGSTDDTPAALRAENRLALRTLRRDDPGGPAAARNEGWRAAQAPLIAFTEPGRGRGPDQCAARSSSTTSASAAWSQQNDIKLLLRTAPVVL
jgi:glycosyltransferase involved in cell wall biosynthesis